MERQTVHMLDGRVYSSTDGWQTVYKHVDGRKRKVGKAEADLVRFLVACGAAE